MRSTSVCLLMAAAALLASGCCVSPSGSCGTDRCSTQFQERCVNGFFRPFSSLRGDTCDSGCGCKGGLIGSNCDCNDASCGAASNGVCGCGNSSCGDNCNGGASMGGSLLGNGLRRPGVVGGGSNGDFGRGNSSFGDNRNGGAMMGGSLLGNGLRLPGIAGGGSNGYSEMGYDDSGYGAGGVSLAGYQDEGGCGHFGCGTGGRLCLSCRLKNMVHGRGRNGKVSGLIHNAASGHGMTQNHPYGGSVPHTEPIPASMGMGGDGSAPTYAYPYYTIRGPRDFLQNNPPTIGY